MKNHETCLLVTEADDPSGMTAATIRMTIDRYWRKISAGVTIDLGRYRENRKRFDRVLKHASGQFGDNSRGRSIENIEILNIGWEEFTSRVNGDQQATLEQRLAVLNAGNKLFAEYGSFRNMPRDRRQGIAGFGRVGEVNWRLFGSMQGAGEFKRLVNENPEGLSDALDQIPLSGQVTREDYDAFIAHFIESFPIKDGKHTRHGLASATRLLTIKRPDYFVCLDRANRKIPSDFGVSVKTHGYGGYWEEIVERVKLATWWNARRPLEALAARVWDGRAAMLDAIYYSPTT